MRNLGFRFEMTEGDEMLAKSVIKGIEEGFDDNEQIADAVEWVSDAARCLAEFEQDNHMQAIEIEKLKTTVAALQKACDQHAAHEYKLIGENEQLRLSKESAADAFCRVLDALSKASPDTIIHHLNGEGACIAMVNDLHWKIDQAKAENERLKAAQYGTPCNHKLIETNDTGILYCIHCHTYLKEQQK